MTDYERLRDTLICEKNDTIDNAAHDVIIAFLNDEDDQEKQDTVAALCGALLPKGEYPNGIRGTVDMDVVLSAISEKMSKMDIQGPDGEVDWDMEHIAEVTGTVEIILNEKGIHICHPFFTHDEEDDEHFDEENGGTLCCLSRDRCPYCGKEPVD